VLNRLWDISEAFCRGDEVSLMLLTNERISELASLARAKSARTGYDEARAARMLRMMEARSRDSWAPLQGLKSLELLAANPPPLFNIATFLSGPPSMRLPSPGYAGTKQG
jgi:hypothetical protein